MRRFWFTSVLFLAALHRPACASTLGPIEAEINGLFKKVNPTVVTVRYSSGGKEFKEMVSTGVIIDRNGHIIAVSHIPSESQTAQIVLSDGQERRAHLVGYDPESRIQVLKTEAQGLSCAEVGNPQEIETGNWVLIVGNSYGLSPSLSMGLISGRRGDNLIQLSGELTPGMGGAGVYNTKGELIGVISSTISRPFYFTLGGVEGRLEIRKGLDLPSQGPGLVLPIDRAISIAGEIIEKGGVEQGWLGVYIRDLDQELRKELKIEGGVVVTRVAEDSPADEAGMKGDDVIVEYEGKKVKESDSLIELVRETKPGTRVKVTLLRKGERRTLAAKVGKKVWEEKEGPYPFEFLPYLKERFERYEFDEDRVKEEIDKLKEELKQLKKELKDLRKEKI